MYLIQISNVDTLNFLLNPLYFECQELSQRHALMQSLPKGIFHSGNFPNVQFHKRQLPKSVLAKALGPQSVQAMALGPLVHPSRSARPPSQPAAPERA